MHADKLLPYLCILELFVYTAILVFDVVVVVVVVIVAVAGSSDCCFVLYGYADECG